MAQAPQDIPLRCRCGEVRGAALQVAPSAGFRFICYCTDCQAFARFLDCPDVLDAAGGTDIFQMPAGCVTLTAGLARVRCLQLSSRVFRWYAECCRTPLANTAGPRFPVVALIRSFMDQATDGGSIDRALGPPLCRIYERSALAPLPPHAPPALSLRIAARRASKILGWWWRGLGRPNPFFDDATQAPRAAPHGLSRSGA